MDTVRTLSDTKRSFYALHARPINSIYRQVVEELMVEMHLLSVNADFRYNPIYALGVVTVFDRFMEGYQPEKDKESIFQALCRSVDANPEQLRQDAERFATLGSHLEADELNALVTSFTANDKTQELQQVLSNIANNSKFKYSRLFGIGLYTLLVQGDRPLSTDDRFLQDTLASCCQSLNLPKERLDKDLDLYRGNLEKMRQARQVIEEALAASRKQRQQRDENQQIDLEKQESPAPEQKSS